MTRGSNPEPTSVIEHLERFCGPIIAGRTTDADGRKMPFQIVQLEHGPVADSVTFSTLGLSFHALKSRVSNKMIRHELVMLARHDAVPKGLPAILQQVANEAISRDYAYLAGEVIGPRGQLFSGSEFKALYASIPTYFPDEFGGVSTKKMGEVIFGWLIPITAEEATFVAANGWNKFEDLLVRKNPDLLDIHRGSVV